ncbi:hypothetical protein [Actinacidiphila bryophytorum]|uniref:Uncharacterized protein n=1 Tax=Actinacidiphila bryophytorum TaxID=1436133 RepID=A0A9W4GXU3_9ACTN|nr:hypothetical protein [Actinacidiphila bryophytorum]MBM9438472.1 hypothetical protein [Actinacidiphila bryophytorum]MBN6542535.1 hypothetical protein [Actinacidiphila bryophytorum]CAG7613259.1 hypothetical protein SBRY_100141 [Actinacidiphila bryophytorum]
MTDFDKLQMLPEEHAPLGQEGMQKCVITKIELTTTLFTLVQPSTAE